MQTHKPQCVHNTQTTMYTQSKMETQNNSPEGETPNVPLQEPSSDWIYMHIKSHDKGGNSQ